MNFKRLKEMHFLLFYMFNEDFIIHEFKKLNLFHSNIVFKIILYLIKSIFKLSRIIYNKFKYPYSYKNKYIFLVSSVNNYNALSPIYNLLKNESILLKTKFSKNFQGESLPVFIPTLLSIFYLPKILFYLYKASPIEKMTIKIYFEKILFSMGYEVFFKFSIIFFPPKSIIFSNDHVFETRIPVYHAEKNGIECFYIQHASVTKSFPPLFSSYALLEGKDAKIKYEKIKKTKTNVKLIGIPKLDGKLSLNSIKNKNNSIGFCSTSALMKSDVINIIQEIVDADLGTKIRFRPHTSEFYIGKYKKENFINGVTFSNPVDEHIVEFLDKIKCLISGNSSVLLEACICGVLPIYYNAKQTTKYRDNIYDKYGYVKNKIAFEINQGKDLFKYLDNSNYYIIEAQKNLKYYCDSIDTKWFNKSSQLAVNYIHKMDTKIIE